MVIFGLRALFSAILDGKNMQLGFDGYIIKVRFVPKKQNTVCGASNHALE